MCRKKSGNGAATILLNMGALDAINTFSEHKIEYPENVLAKFNGTVLVVNESLSDYPEPIDLFSKTVVNFKLHNTLEISFSSRKRMLLTVELAEANSEQEFVNYLRKYQQFSKEKVLQGMCRGDNDEDLIQTKSYLSLKCVLGQCRIKVPVRSKYCTHSQCFDATTFFCLFRGSPSFICPICQTNIRNLKSLFIDAYFEDILKHYSNSDCDQVEVNPDGSWKIPPSLHPYKRASIDIADEEIGQKKKNCSDASFSSLGNEICNLSADSINIHFLLNDTPPHGPPSTHNTTNYVDLTLDSDE
ncbi:E3 SUMO-protein ligase pli1 [Zancudomyces culisetae]|uniref:E3 SUMO-protein ligase pli1 n=1 Tax=Zancudomyces culisetae TaxID=1213189 RepID=A0A1R1PDW5_ZANCU|nr:E3 SUMO-protein ligase pli1 [Zancudomyces culisetae]|eukprot:OMH79156.1 E3 SUMO-protein ligase pli1 [Zancudomyces culisetae]